jgi:hypothetical protein
MPRLKIWNLLYCDHYIHIPPAMLTEQHSFIYSFIRVFDHLPTYIKRIANETKVFKTTSKRFLLYNSFYSTDEYFNFKE